MMHSVQFAPGPDEVANESVSGTQEAYACPAVLIVNADDWGRNRLATDAALECLEHRALSSVSAMLFMEDSERAAELGGEHFVDAGVHLNFTTPFTGVAVPARLQEHLQRTMRFLRAHRYAPMVFHPLLVNSFDYLVKAQLDEFERLYGARPSRLDGHHHMHLCANVLAQQLLPEGTIVRRNFTFRSKEKGRINRAFRSLHDKALSRRHVLTDSFVDLLPLRRERLRQIAELARTSSVEIETHPFKEDERNFLLSGEMLRVAANVSIARGYLVRRSNLRAAGTACEQAPAALHISTPIARSVAATPHISVCICIYKRPEALQRLLRHLDQQKTGGLFTYSIVIADNDPEETGRPAVREMQGEMHTPVKYCCEPQQGIARARNRVVGNADGDYLALIDDDEYPIDDWLLRLYNTLKRYEVDGVLGPVKRAFDQKPPRWLSRSSLYDRPVHPSGLSVDWKQSRTGNVLMKRALVANDPAPFRPEFRAGEDQDFFRRKIAEGNSFVWCGDAVAFEVLPPARWRRGYFVRKALLQGANAALQPNCGKKSLAKSLFAVCLYLPMLPLALFAGQHRFMTLLVKVCDHSGKLLQAMNINPIREEYVSD